jgi:hypothetical protein
MVTIRTLALRAAALAVAIVVGSVGLAALAYSPSTASEASPALTISRAFDAAASMPAASGELRAALAGKRGDRLETAAPRLRSVTVEIRSEPGVSTLVRQPIVDVAAR